jgi:hypothetical protein
MKEQCYANFLKYISDGQWGNWTAFSECSATCGGGNKTQTRQCNNPAPCNGGANCLGEDTYTTSCNNQECPIGK